jgi:tetratricopeptide (TPR) repeat protein
VVGLLPKIHESNDPHLLDGAVDDLSRLDRELATDTAGMGPDRLRVLANLGEILRHRYELRGERRDLEAAIDAAERALALVQAGQPRPAMLLRSLSVLRQTHATRYGGNPDQELATAEDLAAEAVAATGASTPQWAPRTHALAAAQRLRYEVTGQPEHLNRAIDTARTAHAAQPDAPYLASHLALVLRMRYERTGNLADLDEAIGLGRRAATSEDLVHAPMAWANLSTMLEARHAHLGDSADLDEAAALAVRAIEQTTPSYAYHPMFLAILSRVLRDRGAAAKARGDLDEAVRAADAAVTLTPESSPEHPRRLSLLVDVLLARGEPADVARAASVGHRVAAAGRTDPPSPDLLHAAGRALWSNFLRTHQPDERSEAIRCAQLALDCTTAQDPERARVHLSLGDWQAENDPVAAAEHYRAGALQRTAAPSLRSLAAQRCGAVTLVSGRTAEAVSAYRCAVELLPRAASRALSRPDRERHLDRLAGLATDAAAAALRGGQPPLALRLLEQGRGVLFSQLLETRGDFNGLRHRNPRLAERIVGLARLLDAGRADPVEGER